MGRKSKKEGIYAYVCLNHVTAQQKLTTLESNYRPIKLLQKEKKTEQRPGPLIIPLKTLPCNEGSGLLSVKKKRNKTSGGILTISSSL